MNWTIKIVDAPIPGGKAVLVCDENGEVLPNMIGATIENYVGEFATVSVKFSVDGKKIRFAP